MKGKNGIEYALAVTLLFRPPNRASKVCVCVCVLRESNKSHKDGPRVSSLRNAGM